MIKLTELVDDILEGAAFDKLKRKFAAQGKTNPAGLAASIGRKKYGKKKFQAMAAKGHKHESIDEISKKKAISAYADRVNRDDNYDKADKTLSHIEKKFGKSAADDAQSHASAKYYGRSAVDKNNKGKHSDDPLDPNKSSHLSKKITKKGKMSKGYQKGMKSVINNRSPSVKNPDTGKSILAKTAYEAGPQHPAYNAAKRALNK